MKKRLGFTYLTWGWWRQPHKVPVWIYREVRDFCLRGMYGYAPSDLWSLHDYLSAWMPSALRQLKTDGEKWIDWEEIDLEKMAKGFEMAVDDDYLFDEGIKIKDNFQELAEAHEKTRKEYMQHFIDKYNGLWW